MAFLRRGLIERFPLPYVKRVITKTVVDADNPFANQTDEYVFTRAAAADCSVQATSPEQVATLSEGVSTDCLYTIYTSTPLFTAIPDTNVLSDAVYIPADVIAAGAHVSLGGWFTVEKVSHRNSGLISHSEIIVSKDLNLLDKNNNPQYPEVTTLLTNVDTKAKVIAGAFEAPWLAENP